MWDLDDGRARVTLDAGAPLSTIRLYQDHTVVSADIDGNVKLWDIKKGVETKSIRAAPSTILAMEIAP